MTEEAPETTDKNRPETIERRLSSLGILKIWDKEKSGDLVLDLGGIRVAASETFLKALRQYGIEPPVFVPSLEQMPRSQGEEGLSKVKPGVYFTPDQDKSKKDNGFLWDNVEERNYDEKKQFIKKKVLANDNVL